MAAIKSMRMHMHASLCEYTTFLPTKMSPTLQLQLGEDNYLTINTTISSYNMLTLFNVSIRWVMITLWISVRLSHFSGGCSGCC